MKLKSLFYIGFISLFLLVLGCSKKEDSNNNTSKKEIDPSQGKPSSGGKTLEVILVVADQTYKGSLKDSVGTYFMKTCEGLNQAEPLFDVVQMNPSGFYNSEMFQKHRNIIIIDINKQNKNTLYKSFNNKSYPQAVFEFSASNKDSLFSLIRRFAPTIIDKFYDNEHQRVYSAFKKLEDINTTKKLKSNFGFSMTFSNEFYIATLKEDFVWLRKEPKEGSLSITIYSTPFVGEGMFKEEKIIELRDKIAKENIPGPTRGSYMGTEKRFPFHRQNVNINGITTVQTRGLWRLFGDFMGGPFINYCFLDKKNNRFIMIDCFLYSPIQPKRDQLMQLESIVYSLKF